MSPFAQSDYTMQTSSHSDLTLYAIYALVDPRDNSVFYVGLTSDVYHRFVQHINCADTNFAKNARIMELRALNKMVIMETLEEVKGRTLAEEREGYWIKHFQMLREPVVNVSKTSSSRKAKKTNLRLGRQTNLDMISALHQSAQALPASPSPASEGRELAQSGDERKQIIMAAQMQIKMYGKVKRAEIPKLLGKNNRYYSTIKQILEEEGL